VANENDNNVGGVITMWRKNYFLFSNAINGNNYSIIEGEWRLGEAL